MAAQRGDIAAIAQALGGHSRSGDGWVCRCPAHDDRHASLSLNIGTDGRLLWKCHAGCSQDEVAAALKSLGLWPPPKAETRLIVAKYDYRDEAGAQVFQVVRFEPKDFRQRRQARGGDDPAKVRGGWFWSVKGTRVIPYRLPEVRAAIAAGQTVYVVEGEKDADNLASLGAAATCNAGGAGKWRQAHAACLAGADVVILPDNDDAGHKHAAQVTASLAGIAARVRTLELPGLPDKGDVSDWLAAGHTPADLEALADGAPTTAPAPPPTRWQDELIRTRRGEAKAHLANASTALRHAPEWQGVLAFNQLKAGIELVAPPPWAHRNGAWEIQPWTDNDDVRAAQWMQRQGIDIGHTIAHAAIAEAAERGAYHPVRRYLESLEWDGTERIQHFAHDILGADDTPFARAVSSAMLIAAIARPMDPGCKVDTIPVLEGEQGILKSTAIGLLFRPWFIDDLAEMGSKEAADQIRKTWGAEIADLAGFKRADIEKIKAFASRRVDTFRPAYGRAVIEAPRQAVMWATTNQTEWNKDETGGRRFWPLTCGRIDIKRLERERDQYWAEAVHWYRKGEAWWLTDAESQRLARDEQEQRQITDAWDERIEAYIETRMDVSIGEVLQECLGLEAGKWGQSEQNRTARFLRRKGWFRRRPGSGKNQKWRYFRPHPEEKSQSDLDFEGP